MQYVFNVALVNCTNDVRIFEHVTIIIAIYMTLDHVHSLYEVLLYISRGSLPLLAAHHPMLFMLFTSGNIFSLAR